MECLLSVQFTAHKVCVTAFGGVGVRWGVSEHAWVCECACVCACTRLGRHLRFESTLRMCYNDILSATTAAGICRMSLSTNTEPETRTETDTGADKAFIGVELGEKKKFGLGG